MTKEGYIGISTNFEERMSTHMNYSSKLDTHVYRAIRKYGWNGLVKTVIVVSDKQYCSDLEFRLRPKPSIGWNEIPGGNLSPSKNPLVAQKISAALKGGVGRPHTDKTKALIAESNRSRVLAVESKQRIAEAMRKTQLENTAGTYEITFPDGHKETITNLTLWCLSHDLQAKYMFRVCSGERKQYKGYRCKRLTTTCEHEGAILRAN